MARVVTVFCPGAKFGTQSVDTVTAGAAVTLGTNVTFLLNATEDVTVAFGLSTGTAADATSSNYRVPANTVFQIDLGEQFDQFQVYNLSESTATVYYQALAL